MSDTVANDPPRAAGARQWSHALFGYDVFISYTRRDAREYANALALTLHNVALAYTKFLSSADGP